MFGVFLVFCGKFACMVGMVDFVGNLLVCLGFFGIFCIFVGNLLVCLGFVGGHFAGMVCWGFFFWVFLWEVCCYFWVFLVFCG